MVGTSPNQKIFWIYPLVSYLPCKFSSMSRLFNHTTMWMITISYLALTLYYYMCNGLLLNKSIIIVILRLFKIKITLTLATSPPNPKFTKKIRNSTFHKLRCFCSHGLCLIYFSFVSGCFSHCVTYCFLKP